MVTTRFGFTLVLALAVAACGESDRTRPASTDGGGIGDVGLAEGEQDIDASTSSETEVFLGELDASMPDATLFFAAVDVPIHDAAHPSEVAVDGRVELDAPPTLLAIELTPLLPIATAGAPYDMVVTAKFSDSSTRDVTRLTQFRSSDSRVVEAVGSVLLAIAEGTASVTGTYEWKSATVTITVVPAPPMVALVIEPAVASVRLGEGMSFGARKLLADGTRQSLPKSSTDSIQWSTSDSTVALVERTLFYGSAQLQLVSVGTVTMTATYEGFTASALLTVTNPAPIALIITPDSVSIPRSGFRGFTATLVYDDTSTDNVTQVCTWTSSDESVAAVSNFQMGPATMGGGMAFPYGPGTTTITATYRGMTATAVLTVTE